MKKSSNEEWRLVEGTEDYYISSLGRFKRGRKLRRIKEGYYVCNVDRKKYLVHRLVAIAFIDNPNNLPIVDHIDGCKTNNNVENLRWVDYRTNTQAAYDLGLNKGNATYPILVIDSDENGTLYSSQIEASKATGVSKAGVSKVVRGIDKQRSGYRFIRLKEFTDERYRQRTH